MGRHADINTWSSVYLFVQLPLLKIIVLNAENWKKSTSIQIFSFADITLVFISYDSTWTAFESVINLATCIYMYFGSTYWVKIALTCIILGYTIWEKSISLKAISPICNQNPWAKTKSIYYLNNETLQISVNELIDIQLINYLPGGPLIVHWWFSSNSDLEK